jgi:hypothetical protein
MIASYCHQRTACWELLRYRPLQFCLFLKALVGTEEMQRIMANAIRTAQQVP